LEKAENACGTGLLKGSKGEKADGKTDKTRPGRMEVNKTQDDVPIPANPTPKPQKNQPFLTGFWS